MMEALKTLQKLKVKLDQHINFYELRKHEKHTDTNRYEGAVVALKNFRDHLNKEVDEFQAWLDH